MASPSLGGMIDVALHMCKKWDLAFDTYLDDPPSDDEDEIVELSSQVLPSASPQVEDPSMEVDENQGYFNVHKILKHKFQQGWEFLIWWEGLPITAATFEPISSFFFPNSLVNSVFKAYCLERGLTHILKKASSSQ